MTPRYLLDTNIVTEPLKAAPNQNVLAQLQQYQYELAIAATVWHELWYGCQRLPISRRRSTIEKYLSEIVEVSMLILPYDTRAAQWHATERARLTQLGLTPPFADGQIAAITAVNQLVLVTNNEADYAHFPGLQVVNWF